MQTNLRWQAIEREFGYRAAVARSGWAVRSLKIPITTASGSIIDGLQRLPAFRSRATVALFMNALASLEKMLDPAHPCFTAETAANVLKLEPDPDKAARLEELSAKANEGRLNRTEETEYWSYIHAGKLISKLKLQVRLFLKRPSE